MKGRNAKCKKDVKAVCGRRRLMGQINRCLAAERVARSSEHEAERYEFDLAQCRQDDRDANSRIVLVVTAGVAALAFIFGLYSGFGRDGSCATPPGEFFLLLSFGAVEATFSYVASIALVSSLRYWHIRRLEGKIRELRGIEPDVPSWTEVSAPVITLNVRHLKSVYPLAHFWSIALAVAGATAVCVAATVQFTLNSDSPAFAVVMWLCYLPFVGVFLAVAYLASSHSEHMYGFAVERALARLRKKDGEEEKAGEEGGRGALSLLAYLAYPRPMDVMKVLFVILGIAAAVLPALAEGALQFGWGMVADALCVVVVFDFLVYQARYQWNDLRGYEADKKNTRAGARHRLASSGVEDRYAIAASSLVLWYRILCALVMCALAWGGAGPSLLIGSVAAIALGAAYERAKARGASGPVLFLVAFGYPLRMAVGYLAMARACSLPLAPAFPFWLLLAAVTFFGWAFVGLTWAQQGADCVFRGVEPAGNVALAFRLSGLERLRKRGRLDRERPLASGLACAFWNAAMCLSFAALGGSALTACPSPATACLCVGCAVSLFAMIAFPGRMKGALAALVAACFAALTWGWSSLTFSPEWMWLLVDAVSAMGFAGIYVWFRQSNYEKMNSFIDDVVRVLKALPDAAAVLFLGKETAATLAASRDRGKRGRAR